MFSPVSPNSAPFRLGPQAQTKDCNPSHFDRSDGRSLVAGTAIIKYFGVAPTDTRVHTTIQGSEFENHKFLPSIAFKTGSFM